MDKLSSDWKENLTNHEKEVLLPLVVQMLSHRNTKQKVFSNKKIRKVLAEFGEEITEPQIRKIIFHIRNNNIVPLLLANNEGYFVSYSRQDVENWLKMQAGKILLMQETYNSIQNQLKENIKNTIDGNGDIQLFGQMSIYDFQ